MLLTWQVVVKEKRRESLGHGSRCGKCTQPTRPGCLIVVVTISLTFVQAVSSSFPKAPSLLRFLWCCWVQWSLKKDFSLGAFRGRGGSYPSVFRGPAQVSACPPQR